MQNQTMIKKSIQVLPNWQPQNCCTKTKQDEALNESCSAKHFFRPSKNILEKVL